ncbi:hypothetical protein C2G38_2188490 [Gigaspora rosea]|uniref:Uncharacterized protein n=1 Tax=Gigaspora rosea TaxID=44941 RepID=A0A397V4R3_9GLOM|nr:hypothetical protein C2G38_2188490 [Gigaspora rosea]
MTMHTKKSASFIPLALGLILIGFILSTSATPVPGRRFYSDHLSKRTPWHDCDDDFGCGGGYGGGLGGYGGGLGGFGGGLGGYGGGLGGFGGGLGGFGGMGGCGRMGGCGGGFGIPIINSDRLNIFHKHKFIKDKDIDSINRDRFSQFI